MSRQSHDIDRPAMPYPTTDLTHPLVTGTPSARASTTRRHDPYTRVRLELIDSDDGILAELPTIRRCDRRHENRPLRFRDEGFRSQRPADRTAPAGPAKDC